MVMHAMSLQTQALVLDALVREADLDGITTSSSHELADQLGLHHTSANQAIHDLIERGVVKVVGRVGRGGTMVIEVPL